MEEQGYPGRGRARSASTCSTAGRTCNCTSIRTTGTMALKQRGLPVPLHRQHRGSSPGGTVGVASGGGDRIRQWTGRRPVAFRAGNMAASEESLRQLEAAGILIDSSYTFPYAGGQCRFSGGRALQRLEMVRRRPGVALSGFRQPIACPEMGLPKPLDLMGYQLPRMPRRDPVDLRRGRRRRRDPAQLQPVQGAQRAVRRRPAEPDRCAAIPPVLRVARSAASRLSRLHLQRSGRRRRTETLPGQARAAVPADGPLCGRPQGRAGVEQLYWT